MYVVIGGCGRVGSQLAKNLDEQGHSVVVIDKDPDSKRRLGSSFSGNFVVGNVFDIDDLINAGIEEADVFCALTNLDNTNIMACQVAKKIFNVKEVIGRLYNPERLSTYQKLGLEMVCGTSLMVTQLKNRVLTKGYDTVETLPSNDIEIIKVVVPKKSSGKKISDLTLKGEFMPTSLIRNGQGLIPDPDFEIQENDILYFSVRLSSMNKLFKKLNLETGAE
ncbi:MAG: TrkA family potassium uptake protein [Actinobacteria bacterium]|nr:TrkA family potassium uptake protein [Actinomycetota bacterium]